MNRLVRQFYKSGSDEFREVLFLSEAEGSAPDLPGGWRELAKVEGRVELVRDFWLTQLPFHPNATPRIEAFFERLDDVTVVLCQRDDEIWSELVYSLADGSTFFRGLAPARDVTQWKGTYPRDYLAFLSIHNGFGRLSEVGLIRAEELADRRVDLMQEILLQEEPPRLGGRMIDPSALLPFYESADVLRCFYPEIGNIDLCRSDDKMEDLEESAFPSFLEWLASFLEGVE